MHPLSIFPTLLTFSFFAPFILRVAVALFILSLGIARYKKPYAWTAIFYLATGILVLIGLYTQIAAIVAIAILKFDFWVDFWKNRKTIPVSGDKYFLYGISMIILLSLLLTGPGIFAFDLPL